VAIINKVKQRIPSVNEKRKPGRRTVEEKRCHSLQQSFPTKKMSGGEEAIVS
jgi:hypothetical protein